MTSKILKPAGPKGPNDIRVGIDIGGTNIRAGFYRDGKALTHYSHRMPVVGSPEALVEGIAEFIRKFTKEHGSARTQLSFLGISIAGYVDNEKGMIVSSPNIPYIKNFRIASEVARKTGIPCMVDNDVNCKALAEHLYGGHKDADNIVVAGWGTGIGGAAVCGGSVIRGARNMALEIGHTVFRQDGRDCSCGKAGCYEAYVGGWAIEKRLIKKMPGLSVGQLFDSYATSPENKKYIDKLTVTFAQLLANMVVIFNPSMLILSGGIVAKNPWLVKNLDKKIRENILTVDRPGFKVVHSALGEASGMLGASALGSLKG